VASDTADNLKANVSGDLVTLEVSADEQVAVARDKLASLSDAVEVEGRTVSGRVARAGKAVPGLLRDLESGGVGLDAIEVIRPTLDDVFLTLTGRSLRDADETTGPTDETAEGAQQ
jgi:ABC-2 type transport system ATP-binding protein